jgi:hypothetical protein
LLSLANKKSNKKHCYQINMGERSSFPIWKDLISVLLILEKEERGEQWIRFPEMHAVQSVYLWYSWLRFCQHMIVSSFMSGWSNINIRVSTKTEPSIDTAPLDSAAVCSRDST